MVLQGEPLRSQLSGMSCWCRTNKQSSTTGALASSNSRRAASKIPAIAAGRAAGGALAFTLLFRSVQDSTWLAAGFSRKPRESRRQIDVRLVEHTAFNEVRPRVSFRPDERRPCALELSEELSRQTRIRRPAG